MIKATSVAFFLYSRIIGMVDITKIKDPSFLKDLTNEQCQELADEIRTFLVQSISKTGGHLASNLGVVELTIALHKAFNAPKDKIFFDVGHQCYVHKILTGRADQFDSLRQYHGLSGFQKRKESEYDCWEAGHSSTSLSAALGMAIARDLNHENYQVIPVIGDGALESGMSFEALNQIGEEKRRMIIIFNDNNMSISENVGVISKSLSRLRTNERYVQTKLTLKESLNANTFGQNVLIGLTTLKNALKNTVVDRGIFGEYDLDYVGPIDGHNIEDLMDAMETAKEKALDHTVVVHVLTKKGKGYEPCESGDISKWHGVGPFDPDTGKPTSSKKEGYADWSTIMSDSLVHLAKENEDIVAITPAMKIGSRLEEFFQKYPKRSFDTGISEEHAATLAAGLAIQGKRPYLCIYSTFLQRAYDQINHDIGRMDLPVVIGIDRAGLVGQDGPTHHGVFDLGILRPIPNLILSQPMDAKEAYQLLYTAFNQNHPFAIRFGRETIPYQKEFQDELIPIGSWTVFGDIKKEKPIILTYGSNVNQVLDYAKEHKKEVTVINCRFFKPLDENVLNELAQTNQPLYIYETDQKMGGLGSAILEWFSDQNIQKEIHCLGIGDHYVNQGDISSLLKEEHLSIQDLFQYISRHIESL